MIRSWDSKPVTRPTIYANHTDTLLLSGTKTIFVSSAPSMQVIKITIRSCISKVLSSFYHFLPFPWGQHLLPFRRQFYLIMHDKFKYDTTLCSELE